MRKQEWLGLAILVAIAAGVGLVFFTGKETETRDIPREAPLAAVAPETPTAEPEPLVGDTSTPGWCSSTRLNSTEKAICASEELHILENELVYVYGQKKAAKGDKSQLRWLKNRNKCGSDHACIAAIYKSRIAILREAL